MYCLKKQENLNDLRKSNQQTLLTSGSLHGSTCNRIKIKEISEHKTKQNTQEGIGV